VEIHPPDSVLEIMRRLWASGFAAYVVGGSLRDVMLGREPLDWDLTTDARPPEIQALFEGAVYENRFGTVLVPTGADRHEVTTFRSDHEYADHRRPHHVEFGDTVEADLERRDFTVNAMAWGAPAPARSGARRAAGASAEPRLVDPHRGRLDLEARTLRAVGDPRARFEEDALRMLRAVRLSVTLDFGIEPATLAAIQARAQLAAYLSGERVAAELARVLGVAAPSAGLRLLAATNLLEALLPELAAERGVPQNKIPGDDLWDHTVRTVDAVPPDRPVVRLAALLHDVGKPATMADGHFLGHDAVGAEIAATIMARLRTPHADAARVVHLIRHHMFTYDPSWGDAGVRRFIRRIGRNELDSLLALRAADNVGSGLEPDAHGLAELRARVAGQLEGPVVLERGDLAIDGNDLMRVLGIAAGPALGRILDELLERAISDPSLNERETLLAIAAQIAPMNAPGSAPENAERRA
jgi:tRNA nucleotidyltransferase (CCA-adding enzyme)